MIKLDNQETPAVSAPSPIDQPDLLPADSEPVLGDILRRARTHHGLTLRQVEQRVGIPNAHLSQIERGAIKRPDPAILMDLAELYALNYKLLAEWAGYLDPGVARKSSNLTGMALRLFVELDPVAQRDALDYLEQLRNRSDIGSRSTTADLEGPDQRRETSDDVGALD